MSAQPLLNPMPITNNGDEKLGDNTTFFLQDFQGLVEMTWVGELFPFVSFSILSLCILSSQDVCSKCLLHMFGICIHWFLEYFNQANLLMPMDGCHAHSWLQKPASLWTKSPDLATKANNLGTAKWLPPFCRWKDKDTSLECQMLRLGWVSGEFSFTVKVSWWASHLSPLGSQ